jgi:hypothetical protein
MPHKHNTDITIDFGRRRIFIGAVSSGFVDTNALTFL